MPPPDARPTVDDDPPAAEEAPRLYLTRDGVLHALQFMSGTVYLLRPGTHAMPYHAFRGRVSELASGMVHDFHEQCACGLVRSYARAEVEAEWAAQGIQVQP